MKVGRDGMAPRLRTRLFKEKNTKQRELTEQRAVCSLFSSDVVQRETIKKDERIQKKTFVVVGCERCDIYFNIYKETSKKETQGKD
jgi:predicted nucleic-acid-binding Zn-ribbon protein